MTTLMIFTSIIIMGFACSFGCGTITTPFILGSLLGEGQNIKASRNAIALFSLGKIVSLSVLGLLSSLLGATILDMVESVYPNSTVWVIRIFTCLFGVWLLYGVFFKKQSCCRAESCCGCSGSLSSSPKLMRRGFYFGAGVLYSIIPCAPLLTTLGYASTMSPIAAMLLLAVFGIVNSIVPLFGYASLVGMANVEFALKTPQFVKYIKIFGGLLLIGASFFYA